MVGRRDLVTGARLEQRQPGVIVPGIEDVGLGVEEVLDLGPGDRAATDDYGAVTAQGGHRVSRPSRNSAGRSPVTRKRSPRSTASSQCRQNPRMAPSSIERPGTRLTSSIMPRDMSL